MEIGKTFCGRTDGRTHLSSNLLDHRRGDDLMNLSTVKRPQWGKTQSRELLGLFICAQLLHTILHSTILILPMCDKFLTGLNYHLKSTSKQWSCLHSYTTMPQVVRPGFQLGRQAPWDAALPSARMHRSIVGQSGWSVHRHDEWRQREVLRRAGQSAHLSCSPRITHPVTPHHIHTPNTPTIPELTFG